MASRPLCQVLYVSCIISPITGFCRYHNFLYMICMLLDNKDYFIVIVIVIVIVITHHIVGFEIGRSTMNRQITLLDQVYQQQNENQIQISRLSKYM